jgi:hypothetical protein
MKIKIHVTKEILRQSMHCSQSWEAASMGCALSLAVRDLFPEAKVLVGHMLIMNKYVITTTSKMDEFIGLFDRSEPEDRLEIPEQVFEFGIPDFVIDEIGITEAQEIIKNSKTLELV